MSTEQSAELMRVSRSDLRTLLDWYDEPEYDTWAFEVNQIVERLRRQLDGAE